MVKNPAPALEPLRCFYQPHKSVRWDGSVTDPVTGEVTYPPSMTKQEFRDQCDINNIIRQYQERGILEHVSANAAKGVYVDLPDDSDFQSAIHTVMEGERAFATLPSKVRDRFNNDPASFLAFMADPANEAEAREMGLLHPKPPAPAPQDPPKGGAKDQASD